MYSPTDPTAAINGQLVPLRQPATLKIGDAEVTVQAVEITREKVVLETEGKRVELHMMPKTAAPEPARHRPK